MAIAVAPSEVDVTAHVFEAIALLVGALGGCVILELVRLDPNGLAVLNREFKALGVEGRFSIFGIGHSRISTRVIFEKVG
jgi:hypothetical protein